MKRGALDPAGLVRAPAVASNVRKRIGPRHAKISDRCIAISRVRGGRAGYIAGMNPKPLPARYRIAIHRAMGCYFAQVLDLPGCFSRGATEVEAVENARSAIRAYLWLAQALAGDAATVQLEISA